MDLALFESFDGGDVSILGRDIELTDGIFNQVYMGLFGANDVDLPNGQNSEWWGNGLFFPEDEIKQFNSTFEKLLDNVALNSSGIRKLETAAKNDLKFLSPLVEITPTIRLIDVNKIQIDIFVKELKNLNENVYTLIWDATKREEIRENENIGSSELSGFVDNDGVFFVDVDGKSFTW